MDATGAANKNMTAYTLRPATTKVLSIVLPINWRGLTPELRENTRFNAVFAR